MKVKVHVEQIVNTTQLDWEDRQDRDKILGDHYYEVRDEEEALDEFHETVAVSCLSDFEITTEVISNSVTFIKEE